MLIRPRPSLTKPCSAYSLRILVVVSREVPARAASCSWVELDLDAAGERVAALVTS